MTARRCSFACCPSASLYLYIYLSLSLSLTLYASLNLLRLFSSPLACLFAICLFAHCVCVFAFNCFFLSLCLSHSLSPPLCVALLIKRTQQTESQVPLPACSAVADHFIWHSYLLWPQLIVVFVRRFSQSERRGESRQKGAGSSQQGTGCSMSR